MPKHAQPQATAASTNATSDPRTSKGISGADETRSSM